MIHATIISKIMTMRNLLGRFWIVTLICANKRLQRGERNICELNWQTPMTSFPALPFHELIFMIVINQTFISSKDGKGGCDFDNGEITKLRFLVVPFIFETEIRGHGTEKRNMGKTQGSYCVNKLKSSRRLRWLSSWDRVPETRHMWQKVENSTESP